MTQEQFSEACKLQKEIESLQQNIKQLQKIIDELHEGSKYRNLQDIKIQLNSSWVSTPTGSIDSGDLLNFLVQQRIKRDEKINSLKEEFDNI